MQWLRENRGREPWRDRVDMTLVNRDEVKAIIAEAAAIAVTLVPGVGLVDLTMLANAAVDAILDGDTLKLGPLAQRAYIARGHLDERFTPQLHACAEVLVRVMSVMTGMPVLYDETAALPVEVGRRQMSVGTDKYPGAKRALILLVHGMAAFDRFCAVSVTTFNTGTRSDWSSERADANHIAEARKLYGEQPVGPMVEHFQRRFEEEQALQKVVSQAFDEQAPIMIEMRLPGDDEHKRHELAKSDLFPHLRIVGALPSGPRTKALPYTEVLHPGRDRNVVRAVSDHGQRAVLGYGPPATPQDVDDLERRFVPLRIQALPSSYHYEIVRLGNIHYMWHPKRHLLARSYGDGTTELWRIVGFSIDELPFAVSLIERYEQSNSPRECRERWRDQCRPGLVQTPVPAHRVAAMDLLNIVSAAVVAAEREARGRGKGSIRRPPEA